MSANEQENLGETPEANTYAQYAAPGNPGVPPYENPVNPMNPTNPVNPANPYATVNPYAAQRYNSFAVGGFVASFFVSIVGIVLSVIGLSEIKKQGGKGRGLAIAGIVIGAVKIVADIILIIALIIGISSWIEHESHNGGLDGYSYEYSFGDSGSGHDRDLDDFDFGLDSGTNGGSHDDFDDLFEQYQGGNNATAFENQR